MYIRNTLFIQHQGVRIDEFDKVYPTCIIFLQQTLGLLG